MSAQVKVASLSTAKKIKRRFDAVLTVEDPGHRNGLRFHRNPHPDHLVLMFEDVDDPVDNIALPDVRHVEAALTFGRQHCGGSLLVHCKAGVARSAALALAIISDRLGYGAEAEAVQCLLSGRPVAVPNLIVLGMADALLERGGSLVGAWMEVESSHRKYASHRALKRRILASNPALYAPPMSSLAASALRFAPGTLKPEPGLLDGPWHARAAMVRD